MLLCIGCEVDMENEGQNETQTSNRRTEDEFSCSILSVAPLKWFNMKLQGFFSHNCVKTSTLTGHAEQKMLLKFELSMASIVASTVVDSRER